METFFIITHDDGKEINQFFFKDMAMAIIQFREFMQQLGIEEKIKGDMPVSFENENGVKLTLSERDWDDDKLYHL